MIIETVEHGNFLRFKDVLYYMQEYNLKKIEFSKVDYWGVNCLIIKDKTLIIDEVRQIVFCE